MKVRMNQIKKMDFSEGQCFLKKNGYYLEDVYPASFFGDFEQRFCFLLEEKQDKDWVCVDKIVYDQIDAEKGEWKRLKSKKHFSVIRTCPMCDEECDEEHVLWVEGARRIDQMEKYISYGGLIQEKLSLFSKWEREFVKTGYCKKCQEELFSYPEEEED